jgi:hypothetical protein
MEKRMEAKKAMLANLALWLGAAVPAGAAVYHIGPARADKAFADVVGKLAPGDSLYVDGNATYASVAFTRPGTAAAPIVVQGLPVSGKRPVISGGTNTVHFRSDDPYDHGADHYVFQGFEITGGSSRCLYHQADDITVRDVVIHDCPLQGLLGGDQGSGSLTLERSEVYHCGSGDRNHQIYMATDEVHHPGSAFRMRHCYLHDANGGNNVKSRAERNEIQYNWIEGAYYHELELIGPDPGGAPDGWDPRLKREDSDVLGNVFRKRRTAAGNDSDFAVFRIGGDGTGESHGRYRFAYNTVIAGTGAVFRCFDSLESVEMHGNVFHRPGGGLNLMRTAEAAWTQGHAVIAGSGNWITSGAANAPAQWTGTLQGTDPGFASLADNDFRPKAGSPLIDAGPSAPQGPAGFAFPSPAFPPVFSPPPRALAAAPVARPAQGALDIGAYEAGTVIGLAPRGKARAAGDPGGPEAGRGEGRMLWDGRGAPAFGGKTFRGKPARYRADGRSAEGRGGGAAEDPRAGAGGGRGLRTGR